MPRAVIRLLSEGDRGFGPLQAETERYHEDPLSVPSIAARVVLGCLFLMA